jgi:hypothetical protein
VKKTSNAQRPTSNVQLREGDYTVIDLDLNRKEWNYLHRLLATGLWGKTVEEVCVRIIDLKLFNILARGELASVELAKSADKKGAAR